MVFFGRGCVVTRGGDGVFCSSDVVFDVTIAATPRTATVVNKTISEDERVIGL
jgi:hypothetical protein